MFRKLKEEGGSGIIWAMAVAGFLLILVGAVLSISLAYQNRSRRNDDARQAYLTARSAADMVAQEFISGSPTAAEIFAYLLEEAWTVEDVGFAADMGRCSLHAVLEPYDGNTNEAGDHGDSHGRGRDARHGASRRPSSGSCSARGRRAPRAGWIPKPDSPRRRL